MSEIMRKSLSNPAHRYANNNISTEELIGVFPSHKKEEQSSKCLVYTLALFVVIMVIWLVLAFVTSHVGDPKIEFRSARLMHNTHSYRNISTTSPLNVTIIARVTLTNPSFASFSFRKSSVSVMYENSGVCVGVSKLKAATLEAKETKDLNLKVQMRLGQKELVTSNLTDHYIFSDMFKLRSYAKLSGTVHVLKLLKKKKTIQMSCTINLNLTSFSNQRFHC